MKCPFCDREMKKGIISGDGRGRVYWKSGDKKAGLADKLVGTGQLTAVKYSLAVFTIESYYCEACKKMIFETDISK